MNLIFIYGPPAAGKLTVAHEIARNTGYKVFDNHSVLNVIAKLFPFEDQTLATTRRRLSRQVRLDIFREAAAAHINFITTFGTAGQEYFDFYRDVKKEVEARGGQVLFVQLLASKDTLLERVGNSSRNGKINTKQQLENLFNDNAELCDKFPDVEHPTVDNTNLTPQQAAIQIIDYFKI